MPTTAAASPRVSVPSDVTVTQLKPSVVLTLQSGGKITIHNPPPVIDIDPAGFFDGVVKAITAVIGIFDGGGGGDIDVGDIDVEVDGDDNTVTIDIKTA